MGYKRRAGWLLVGGGEESGRRGPGRDRTDCEESVLSLVIAADDEADEVGTQQRGEQLRGL